MPGEPKLILWGPRSRVLLFSLAVFLRFVDLVVCILVFCGSCCLYSRVLLFLWSLFSCFVVLLVL